jgi:hypothetical protein
MQEVFLGQVEKVQTQSAPQHGAQRDYRVEHNAGF